MKTGCKTKVQYTILFSIGYEYQIVLLTYNTDVGSHSKGTSQMCNEQRLTLI